MLCAWKLEGKQPGLSSNTGAGDCSYTSVKCMAPSARCAIANAEMPVTMTVSATTGLHLASKQSVFHVLHADLPADIAYLK